MNDYKTHDYKGPQGPGPNWELLIILLATACFWLIIVFVFSFEELL